MDSPVVVQDAQDVGEVAQVKLRDEDERQRQRRLVVVVPLLAFPGLLFVATKQGCQMRFTAKVAKYK